MQRQIASKFYINSLDENGDYTDKTKTLLLVVDEQPRLMTTMEDGEKTTINTIALIDAFNKYEMHVLATEQYPKGLGRSDERILEKISEDKIFDKTSFNAAIPQVLDYIKENDIKKVVVTGAEGHICVHQTIRSLLDLGLDVYYVDDAISSFSNKLKNSSKKSLVNMGAVLVNTELVLFDLAKDSKDPHFKFISNLVKEIRK